MQSIDGSEEGLKFIGQLVNLLMNGWVIYLMI